MGISLQGFIGKIGESVAIKTLSKMGFKICRADAINTVGHSLMLDKTLREFDCSNLHLLSTLCSQLFFCWGQSQPCTTSFHEFDASTLAHGDSADFSRIAADTFSNYCMSQMSRIAILNKCHDKCNIQVCPIKLYLTIDHYIKVFPTLNRILNTEEQIDDISGVLGRESETKKCDKYLDVNHCIADLFGNNKEHDKHLVNHPGRIDLFGYKNNQYYCFEVKTNKSRLSPWQVIRLNWMKEHGFASAIILVNLEYQDEKHFFKLYNPTAARIEELIEIFKPTLSIQEFELSHYPKFHCFIPSTKDVEFYNCRWLSPGLDTKAIIDKRKNISVRVW